MVQRLTSEQMIKRNLSCEPNLENLLRLRIQDLRLRIQELMPHVSPKGRRILLEDAIKLEILQRLSSEEIAEFITPDLCYRPNLERVHAQILESIPHTVPEVRRNLLELESKMDMVHRLASEDKIKPGLHRQLQLEIIRRQALVFFRQIEPESRRRQVKESLQRVDAEMRRNQTTELMATRSEVRRIQREAISRSVRKALHLATGLTESDPAWLLKLKLEGRSALDDPEVERRFLEAAKGNKDDFRKAAAGLLSAPNHKGDVNAHELVLIFGWMAPEHEPLSASFCYYNDKALGKLFAFLVNVNEIGEKQIRKVWERLGLKKARALVFRDVEITKDPQTGHRVAQPISYQRWAKLDKMREQALVDLLRPSLTGN